MGPNAPPIGSVTHYMRLSQIGMLHMSDAPKYVEVLKVKFLLSVKVNVDPLICAHDKLEA